MKEIKKPLKNTVVTKDTKMFQHFFNNFTTIKRIQNDLYDIGDRNVDYVALTAEAKRRGIKRIPKKDELDTQII